MIKLILFSMLLTLFAYALSQASKSRVVAYAIALCSLVGSVLVWAPDITNWIAHKLGVGRGSDLLFYLFIVMMFSAVFNLHMRIRQQNEILTRVVRDVALKNASDPGDGR